MARPPDPLVGDGILIVDKAAGMSSHDVVGAVRRIAGTRKVGHAGTLDPMATGVLVIGVNRATRLLTYLVGCDKEYLATIRLGVATHSDDATGEVIATPGAAGLNDEAIAYAVQALTGAIAQRPSSVSAIKVAGERAYARVRAGEHVELAARTVTVHSFELTQRRDAVLDAVNVVDLDVVVRVSAGTYVRALARDLGERLGTGGHLTALRRTTVGAFSITDAHAIEDLRMAREQAQPGTSGLPMISMAGAASSVMPARMITSEQARALTYGQFLPPTGTDGPVAAILPAPSVDGEDMLVAILSDQDGHARPQAVFTSS